MWQRNSNRLAPLFLLATSACGAGAAARGGTVDAAPAVDAPLIEAGAAEGSPPGAHAACTELQLDENECSTLMGTVLTALPIARGNSVGDNEDAAALGFKVFYDARFSGNLQMRCASCHQPESGFDDGRKTPQGLAPIDRNVPTVLNAARLRFLFWDGRADSVWAQPLFAIESPAEMSGTRLEVAHTLARLYAPMYQSVFGAMPDLSDPARFPAKGKPGDAAYDSMSSTDRAAIDGVVANFGKSIEAYLRKISAGRSAVDRYLTGEPTSLSDGAKRGLRVFVRSGCTACHSGPMFSDQHFHNLGVAAAPGASPDRGREDGLPTLLANPFNAKGAFFEGQADVDENDYRTSPSNLGAFRTPSLRNLTTSAPYGHNGSFATLEEMVDFLLQGGGAGKGGFTGAVDPLLVPHPLSASDRSDLLEMLRANTGDYPAPPWNNWPGGSG